MEIWAALWAIGLSAVTAWVTASLRVGLSRKAERNDDALRSLHDLMIPYIRQVMRFRRVHITESFSEEPEIREADVEVVAAIVELLPDLHRWRRVLVERRARRLFGDRTFEIMEMLEPGASFEEFLGQSNVDRHLSQEIDEPSRSSTWMTNAPQSKEVDSFLRGLKRLQAGR